MGRNYLVPIGGHVGDWDGEVPIKTTFKNVTTFINVQQEPKIHLEVYVNGSLINTYKGDLTHSLKMFKMEYIHQPGQKRVVLTHPSGSILETYNLDQRPKLLRFQFKKDKGTDDPDDPPKSKLVVETINAEIINDQKVKFTGKVISIGRCGLYKNADVYFEYAEEGSLKNPVQVGKTSVGTIGEVTTEFPYSNIKRNTTYHYRFVGSCTVDLSTVDNSSGEIKTFGKEPSTVCPSSWEKDYDKMKHIIKWPDPELTRPSACKPYLYYWKKNSMGQDVVHLNGLSSTGETCYNFSFDANSTFPPTVIEGEEGTGINCINNRNIIRVSSYSLIELTNLIYDNRNGTPMTWQYIGRCGSLIDCKLNLKFGGTVKYGIGTIGHIGAMPDGSNKYYTGVVMRTKVICNEDMSNTGNFGSVENNFIGELKESQFYPPLPERPPLG